MAYQIECVVTEVVLGEKVLFSFEPTSKYQLKINGKTIYVAVDSNGAATVPKIVAVPSENLSRVKPVHMCAVALAIGLRRGSSVVLEVQEVQEGREVDKYGKLVAFTK